MTSMVMLPFVWHFFLHRNSLLFTISTAFETQYLRRIFIKTEISYIMCFHLDGIDSFFPRTFVISYSSRMTAGNVTSTLNPASSALGLSQHLNLVQGTNPLYFMCLGISIILWGGLEERHAADRAERIFDNRWDFFDNLSNPVHLRPGVTDTRTFSH